MLPSKEIGIITEYQLLGHAPIIRYNVLDFSV